MENLGFLSSVRGPVVDEKETATFTDEERACLSVLKNLREMSHNL